MSEVFDIEFVDTVVIATRMGVTPKHARDRITQKPGFPRGYKFGRRCLYRKDEFEAWFSQLMKKFER